MVDYGAENRFSKQETVAFCCSFLVFSVCRKFRLVVTPNRHRQICHFDQGRFVDKFLMYLIDYNNCLVRLLTRSDKVF